MRKFKFTEPLQIKNQPGAHSFIADLDIDYYRPNKKLVLKVFKETKTDDVNDFLWKENNFVDCTKIQNIYWNNQLAPRVYDIVEVEDLNGRKYYAQITDFIEEDRRGSLNREVGENIIKLAKEWGVSRGTIDSNIHHNYIDVIVDFSHYTIDHGLYKQKVIDIVKADAGWGSNPATYQSVDQLGVSGQRDLKSRLPLYKFDEIDFKGKTVIDYGCSSGHIMREAVDRGAAFAVGIDTPQVANAARVLNNYLGYYNMDFYGGNFDHKGGGQVYEKIQLLTGMKQFDIVFYLSCQQLGMPDYLQQIVGELFILEGHVPDKEETYRDILEKDFANVEFTGATRDHGPRPVFICRK